MQVKEARTDKVRSIMDRMGLDALIVRGMENIFYLSGFEGSEGMLFVSKGDVVLVTDFRYIIHAREVATGIRVVESKGKDTLPELCGMYGVRNLGFDSHHTQYVFYERWKEVLPDVVLSPVGMIIEEIRKQKDADEITAIRESIRIATLAFTEIFDRITVGMTERQIAGDLEYAMRKYGADDPSFDTIVASGPRAALPHADPTDRKIGVGESIVIDFGVRKNGYCSDETCTVSIGEPAERIREITEVVRDARNIAFDVAKAGMPVKDLDAAVRRYIEKAGYGEYFRHGTGHGIGIAVHEAPSINALGDGVLEPGMVITIEPGIYIPNVGGVRLEDVVLIGDDGVRILTELRKDIINTAA